MDKNNTRIPAAVDNDDDVGNENDDEDERAHRHRHGNGNGHRQRREHGHGQGHRQRETAAGGWMRLMRHACAWADLLRLPPFLVKPKHQYSIKVGDTCERTFKCPGIKKE